VARELIEVRGYKRPRRPRARAQTRLLGEDQYGRWLGAAQGDTWTGQDTAGVFLAPVVKLVPRDTYWTACFQPVEPVVDVDIVLPPRWLDGALEEVDLELDILRSAAGQVWVRDRDEFESVRERWPMPQDLVMRAEATCEEIRAQVERRTEPFGEVGLRWLRLLMEETSDWRL